MKYLNCQTKEIKVRHQDRESALRVKIHAALGNGDFDLIKSVMKKYPKDEIYRFLERNLAILYIPCLFGRNTEAITFLIANAPKKLLLKAIEKKTIISLEILLRFYILKLRIKNYVKFGKGY